MFGIKPMKENKELSIKMGGQEEMVFKKKEQPREPLDFLNPPTQKEQEINLLNKIKENAAKEQESNQPIQEQDSINVVYADQEILNRLEILINNDAVIYDALKKICKAANIKLEEETSN